MELVQDLFLTASFALILSFLVAKLVAMAVAGRDSEPPEEFKQSVSAAAAGGGVVKTAEEKEEEEEEVSFVEKRLKVEAPVLGQRRVEEFVDEVKAVDQFQEVRELTAEVSKEEESVAVGLPEKSSEGEEKVSVEEASDSDRQNSEESKVEEIGAKSVTDGIVPAQSEEVRAAEAAEGKLDNSSDDDDWEGIEKSELDDDDFAAGGKFEGR